MFPLFSSHFLTANHPPSHLPDCVSSPFPTVLTRFLTPGYVLAVVGAYACLVRWIAVQVRFFLSSHLFTMITDDLNPQALANLSRFVSVLSARYLSVGRQ